MLNILLSRLAPLTTHNIIIAELQYITVDVSGLPNKNKKKTETETAVNYTEINNCHSVINDKRILDIILVAQSILLASLSSFNRVGVQ